MSSSAAWVPAGPLGRRLVVVGDVHGCAAELEELLAKCEVGSDEETRGDLVGKGPYSKRVVELVRALRPRALCIKGNHDEYLVRVHRVAAAMGLRRLQDPVRRAELLEEAQRKMHVGADYLQIAEELEEEELEWLDALPYFAELGRDALSGQYTLLDRPASAASATEREILVVHAGVAPGVPLEEQSTHQLCYMRNVLPDGSPTDRIDAGRPWIETWEGPGDVVFGHDARRMLQVRPHAFGLDTGCCYGGQLSAVVFPSKQIVQVPARRVHSVPKGSTPLQRPVKVLAIGLAAAGLALSVWSAWRSRRRV